MGHQQTGQNQSRCHSHQVLHCLVTEYTIGNSNEILNKYPSTPEFEMNLRNQ